MQRRIIVVRGSPASVNASTQRKRAWKRKVRECARKVCKKPWRYTDLRINVQFFQKRSRLRDVDNISKPICDALQGIAYRNDSQLITRHAEIKTIDGHYKIVGVNLSILRALARGEDFVAITVERIGEGRTNI